MHPKLARYSALVAARKECALCANSGLTNPAHVEGGQYDGDEIGPWTMWNGDLDARIMVVGQEWGDVAGFVKQKGLDAAGGTNGMLRELLASVGVDIAEAPTRIDASGVFLTNAVLCLKKGGAQADVLAEWFDNCATAFLRAQVELVQPRVVVALGERAFRALCRAFRLASGNFRAAVERRRPVPLTKDVVLVPVYHCGRRILNTHRKRAQQFEDWKTVKESLEGSGA